MKIRILFSIVCISPLLCLQLAAQTLYHLTPESRVKISGTSTLSDWTATGSTVTGQMELKKQDGKKTTGMLQNGEIAAAEITFDVASIHSERGETMDNKIYKALKRDEFPVIYFRLRDPVQMKKTNEREAVVVAGGDLSIAGVTRSISFDMDVSRDNEKWVFHGKKSLKMSDFSVEPPTAMFGQIVTGDEIEIDVNLIFN